MWLEPVWTTLRYGQIDIVIATLILYDLSRPEASRWKGAAIGLATGLKLTPAIFILYLLLRRSYRAAAVALTVFAATVLVGFVVVPRDSGEFWGGAFIDPRRVGRIENAANQTLRGAVARLLHSTNVEFWWLLIAAFVGVGGMLLAARAGRRGDDVQGFSVCALTGLLISPISWSHHWVLAIAALLLFTVNAVRGRSIGGLGARRLPPRSAIAHDLVGAGQPPRALGALSCWRAARVRQRIRASRLGRAVRRGMVHRNATTRSPAPSNNSSRGLGSQPGARVWRS